MSQLLLSKKFFINEAGKKNTLKKQLDLLSVLLTIFCGDHLRNRIFKCFHMFDFIINDHNYITVLYMHINFYFNAKCGFYNFKFISQKSNRVMLLARFFLQRKCS